MRLQRMLGHLSVLATAEPDNIKDVLVVACGAGVTAGSFVPYPYIEKITICDIEPLVPKVVTPMFGEQNYHIVDGIDKENPHKVEVRRSGSYMMTAVTTSGPCRRTGSST